jgi:hypothetical protein
MSFGRSTCQIGLLTNNLFFMFVSHILRRRFQYNQGRPKLQLKNNGLNSFNLPA